jgi:uncharacterized protein (TIGR02271 family)
MEDKKVRTVNLGEGQELKIPVAEERMRISKQVIESGSVRISKKVLEEEVVDKVSVLQEDFVIEKRELNQFVDAAPPPVRQEGDTTIISVVKEVVVKRLMLVEEIHIKKQKTETTVPVRETLRREEVTVRRSDDGTNFGLL